MFFSFLLKIVPFTAVAALAYGVFSIFLHENARRKEREYLAFAVLFHGIKLTIAQCLVVQYVMKGRLLRC